MKQPRFKIGRLPYFLGLLVCAIALNRALQFRLSDGIYLTQRLGSDSVLIFDASALAAATVLACARARDAGWPWVTGFAASFLGVGGFLFAGWIAVSGKGAAPMFGSMAGPIMYLSLIVGVAAGVALPLVIGTLPSKTPMQATARD